MPRLSIEEYLALQKKNKQSTSTPVSGARTGFDAAKYASLKESTAAGAPQEEGGITREKQTIGTRLADIVGGGVRGFSGIGYGIKRAVSGAVEATTGYKDFAGKIPSKGEFETMTGTDIDTRAGKVGKFAGEVAQYSAPGGASMALPKLGFRAATGAAAQALEGGEINTGTAVSGAASAFLPPALAVGGKALNSILRNAIKGTGGIVSGQGTKVIDTIYKNPIAAKQGMREVIGLSADAAKIKTGVSNIAKTASKEFSDDLASLPKRLGRTPKVITDSTKTTIKVDGKSYVLSKKGVKSSLTNSLRKFDVKVDPKKKTFDFSEAPLDSNETKRLREVFDVIDNWTDTTPVGFHKLSRKIKNFRKPGEQSAELNAIIDTTSSNIHGYIGKRIPAAKDMLTKYAKAQDVLETFEKEFATKGRMIGGEADRIRTEKKLATIFSGEKSSGVARLQESLPGGSDILGRQAGRMVSDQVPRSMSTIGDKLGALVNAVITPKMVGEVAAFLGTTVPKAEAFLMKLQKADPATRALMLEAVTDLMGTEVPESVQE